jgi:hypothetical protein
MFKLIRAKFENSWDGARVYRLVGLFLFEFVVVLLGVLAAQAVADWGDDRRLARDAESQFQEARAQAIENARTMRYWAAVAPCLIKRAKQVARVAASGETMPAAAIGRPALPWMRMPSWDEDVRRAAIARIGKDRMDALAGIEAGVEIALETTTRIRDAWSTFALLDPANGQPTDVDRGNVRLAAIRVVDHIRVMQVNTPLDAMQALGVDRSEWDRVDFENAQYDRCGLIRDWQ